jgi:hypothetical protein
MPTWDGTGWPANDSVGGLALLVANPGVQIGVAQVDQQDEYQAECGQKNVYRADEGIVSSVDGI